MALLEAILATKRDEIARLRHQSLPAPPPRRWFTLRRDAGAPLTLIAEIKLRSPSAGALSRALSVADRAAAYQRAGAGALSVLTDESYFGGAPEHLAAAREATTVPILCKDFILDETQLDRARAHGADLALLIVRCLAPDRLSQLIAACRARELVPLVEVTTALESRVAVDAGAELVGVNARDLDTLQMDPTRARAVLSGLPSTTTRVHLSGLKTPEDVRAVAGSVADAALIGEALMRLDDPEPLLRRLVAAAC